MNIVPAALSRVVASKALVAGANAPKLLFVAGVGGSVASTVMACRATLKLSDTLSEAKENLYVAKSIDQERYDASGESREKDVAIIYVRSAASVARLYAPAVLVGAASIYCLTKSHNLLQERNLALMAAYAAIERSYGGYREEVVDRYGEDVDRDIRQTAATKELAGMDDSGQPIPKMLDPNDNSVYARFFDQTSPSWCKEAEYNHIFLLSQQQWANDMLHARGHMFLNEIYDNLGIQRSRAGAVVGWILDEDSDNYIDFGIFDGEQIRNDFVNGREGSILLDFNVDGVIFDKIREHGERLRWQS